MCLRSVAAQARQDHAPCSVVSLGHGCVWSRANGANGQNVQGTAYSAVGSVLPTSMGGDQWAADGAKLQKQGQEEVDAAKAAAAADATVDATKAKAKS